MQRALVYVFYNFLYVGGRDLDYTTKEGQRRGKDVADYVHDTAELVRQGPHEDDPYLYYAILYEAAREADQIKDTR